MGSMSKEAILQDLYVKLAIRDLQLIPGTDVDAIVDYIQWVQRDFGEAYDADVWIADTLSMNPGEYLEPIPYNAD
jgi:hypothetical protein